MSNITLGNFLGNNGKWLEFASDLSKGQALVAAVLRTDCEYRTVDLPQECFRWCTLVLGIINLQVTLPCDQLCSNMKLEDSAMKADGRNWLRIVFKGRPCGTFWFCYPCRLSYHVPS
jgi:hypothetical protein